MISLANHCSYATVMMKPILTVLEVELLNTAYTYKLELVIGQL